MYARHGVVVHRNIECGVLIQSAAVASALTRQFDSLIDAGLLSRLPLS